jgi:hypothetical protein
MARVSAKDRNPPDAVIHFAMSSSSAAAAKNSQYSDGRGHRLGRKFAASRNSQQNWDLKTKGFFTA